MFNNQHKVAILCFGNTSLEAMAIRSMLEGLNVQVQCYFIGNVIDYVELISSQASEVLIVICAHGDDQGTIIDELASEIEAIMPYKKILTAENYQEFLKLKGQVIINTSCLGANLAGSFIQSGASYYVGADGYVDGSASTYFVVSFLYNLFYLKLAIRNAYNKAAQHDTDTRMFKLFE